VSGVTVTSAFPHRFAYTLHVSYPYYSTVPKLGLLHKPIGKDWTPFMCGVSDKSYTAGMTLSPMMKFSAYLKSYSLSENDDSGLFGHIARLSHTVPASQIVRICTKARDGERPSQEWRHACGRPPTTWIHQICRDTGVAATEALQLAEDRPSWRMIATAGGFG